MPETYYWESTQAVEVKGLYDEIAGAFLNNAVVNATLYEKIGHRYDPGPVVQGVSWPVALSYLAGTSGEYRGVIPAAAQLSLNKAYLLKVVASQGGNQRTWLLEVVVKG